MNSQSPVAYYFKLQYLRIIRMLKDNGIYPWLLIPLIVVLFVILTIRLLDNFAYGEWLYLLIGISLAIPLTDQQRLAFLNQISNNNNFIGIRIIEQAMVLMPFIVGLLIYQWYLAAAALVLIGVYLSIGKLNYHLPYSFPTPFGKQPFEFPSGFRKSFILILLAYTLVPIGLNVGNFNLAMASIAAIGFIVGGFHTSPEPRFYVWIFKMDSNSFLKNKIITISRFLGLLLLPVLVCLLVYDFSKIGMVVLVSLASILFTIMCMLSKYISYPQEINVVQGLAMGGAILFPPIMLVIIPWFYVKARRRLQTVLK